MKKFTKKALNELKKEKGFSNRLEKRVINDLLSNLYTTSELKNYITDIVEFGCSGGTVTSLIYYSDTVRFFNNYRREILNMVKNSEDVCWIDHTKYSVQEKNSLTWFVYENIVYRIAEYFNLI